nr:hypothetical protein [Endozoicomonas sp.]
MLARIITDIGNKFGCHLFPGINILSAIAVGNPTEPDEWDWNKWLTAFYHDKDSAGQYFEKSGMNVPHRLLEYLNKRMTREQLFNLVQHEDVATTHECVAHQFNQLLLEDKRKCDGLSSVYQTFQQMGVPLTLFIKTMIKLGYLTEQEINHVFQFREVHSVRQPPEARHDDHVKSVNMTKY